MEQRRGVGVLAAVFVVWAVAAAVPSGPVGATTATWVLEENARPGTTAWKIPNDAPADIQGYADHVSAIRDMRVRLFVDTPAATFHVEAYRLGYYGGLGGRSIWVSREITGTRQPAPTVDEDTLMVEAAWSRSMTFRVRRSWVQGSYLLKLVASTGGQSYVPIVIRDDTSTAALLIQHQAFTWQAYNAWGGASLYHGATGFESRSRVVSFDRPYEGRGAAGMLKTLALIAMVERGGMDVTYWTDLDLHLRPQLLTQHRALVLLNHDEYWSTAMRRGVETARGAGVNLVNLGANAVYRHVRLEDSPLGRQRRVVAYKVVTEDPLYGVDNDEVTVNWRDLPLDEPESALLGAMYECYGVDHADMVIVDADAWAFAGSGVADGTHIPGAVDAEYDRVFPDEPTPANIQVLAHSPVACHEEPSMADMTYYTAESGAGVVDVGSIGWLWTLRCGKPVSGSWCSPASQAITRTILTQAAAGPLGEAHPAEPNAASFGYVLTDPTVP